MDRIASVGIAPANDGFVVGFAFGQDAPAAPDKLGVVAFNHAGAARPSPTIVVDAAGAPLALGSLASAPAQANAVMLFRRRASDAKTGIANHVVAIAPSGALMGAP